MARRTKRCALWPWSSSRRARSRPPHAFNFAGWRSAPPVPSARCSTRAMRKRLARELFANGRTVLEWNCGRRMASRSSVKLLLNLCLIAASAVPRGGVITVDISGEDDAMTMRVEAKGTNARLSHSAADFLTNAVPNEPIDGHSIQLYFTTLLARECHATLNVSTSPENVTLTVARSASDEGRRGCNLFRRRLAGRVTGPSRPITSNETSRRTLFPDRRVVGDFRSRLRLLALT